MELWASQSGNPVLGCLLLPLVFGAPFVALLLAIWTALKPVPQSVWVLVLMLLSVLFDGYIILTGGVREFFQVGILGKIFMVVVVLGIPATLVSFCLDSLKRKRPHSRRSQ